MNTYFPNEGGSFEVFAGDTWAQTHAQSWADDHLSSEQAAAFVPWLLSLPPAEQDRIWYNGYDACRRQFEEAQGVSEPPPSGPSPFNLDGSRVQRF